MSEEPPLSEWAAYLAALDDYWTAMTPEQERDAYARLRKSGHPPSYGEAPYWPTPDDFWL